MVDGSLDEWVGPFNLSDLIMSSDYYHFPGSSVTVCVLFLKNGRSAVGKSDCVDLAFYDETLERSRAYGAARMTAWHELTA